MAMCILSLAKFEISNLRFQISVAKGLCFCILRDQLTSNPKSMNTLNRRDFLKGSSALATLASFGLLGMDFKDREGPLQVALIGAGWYGKSDLFRLIQVADVEVVGLC